MSLLLPGLAAVNFQSVVAGLPHRPVDLFVYAFLLVSVALFWHVGRRRPQESEPEQRPE